MQWSSLLALVALAPAVYGGMMRFSCSQLVVERLDPLVNPGVLQSPHLHQIAGGNAFDPTLKSSADDDMANRATCTTCTFTEDLSNYWTAALYFRARNGTFKRVPQMANQFLEGANGGLTVYYITPYDNKTKATAFKPGFRMLVGDPTVRTNRGKKDNEARQISFRCFDKNFGGPGAEPGGGADTMFLPNKPCLGGIRAHSFFPTCWDGKNVDSPDHKSHVTFPAGGNFQADNQGKCPSTHPVKIPQVFYEVVFDTREFNDKSTWPTDGSQPFVFAQGDPTGYGHHADYVFGWKGNALQKAVDADCGVTCNVLKTQSRADANKCTQKQKVTEEVEGWLQALPGSNPVTFA